MLKLLEAPAWQWSRSGASHKAQLRWKRSLNFVVQGNTAQMITVPLRKNSRLMILSSLLLTDLRSCFIWCGVDTLDTRTPTQFLNVWLPARFDPGAGSEQSFDNA
jgi:hypothetical protein